MAVYHAFPYGKGNQSFKLENEINQSLYEANLIKFKLLSANEYEFINRKTGAIATHNVGKTVTLERGGEGYSITTASYFKLDGVNCFDALREMGYPTVTLINPNLIHPEFALSDKNGTQAAVYKMNVAAEKEEGVMAIGSKQNNIEITTFSDDIDAIFLGAFILSRVDYSMYLTRG